jgi:hypothetical protein
MGKMPDQQTAELGEREISVHAVVAGQGSRS